MKLPEKLLQWMRTCIFSSTMSVLVNGSPTDDFVVGKGLRQGDPLALFLFHIAAKGLTRLTRKAAETGVFRGFKVKEDLIYDILQYADDTILIGEGTWANFVEYKNYFRMF